jgi:hypothetical protein
MSTPTPLTDAVYLEHRHWANEDEATEAIEDFRDFARTLERELAKANAILASIEEDGTEEHNAAVGLRRELATERATLAGVIEIKRGVEAELAEMKRMLSSEKLMYKLANDSAIKHEWAAGELRNELAAERKKVKTLREACCEIERYAIEGSENERLLRAALAATEDKP